MGSTSISVLIGLLVLLPLVNCRGVHLDDDQICPISLDRVALNKVVSSLKSSFKNILKTDISANEDTVLKLNDLSEVRPLPVNPAIVPLRNLCNHMGRFFSPGKSNEISKIWSQYQQKPSGGKAATIVFKVMKNALGNYLSENNVLDFGPKRKTGITPLIGSFTIPKSTVTDKTTVGTDASSTPGSVVNLKPESETNQPDNIVGCISHDSPLPKLCQYNRIREPVALCRSIPEDLSYVRKVKSQLDLTLNYDQSIFNEILASLKSILKKLGETNTSPDFEPDTFNVPANEKKNCLDLKVELLKEPIKIPVDSLVTPTEAEKFIKDLTQLSSYLKSSQEHLNQLLSLPLSSSNLALIPEIDRISDLSEILTSKRLLIIQTPLAVILLVAFTIISILICKVALHFLKGGEERAHARIARDLKAQYEAPPYQG